jgi:hypothetical protein
MLTIPQAVEPLSADAIVAAANAPPDQPPESELYWAAREAKAVVEELHKKERAFFEFVESRGFMGAWIAAYCQHFGLDPNDLSTWATQSVGFGGDNDELVMFRVNESRSFTDQLVTMAIGTRPAFQTYATNTNYDSLGQTEIADRIVDYVYRARFGERKERHTVERGVLLGLSYTWIRWDKDAGEMLPPEPVIDPATQAPIPVMRTLPDGSQQPAMDPKTGRARVQMRPSMKRTGNIAIKVLNPWDVFCEPRVEDPDDHLWRVAKERRSKWEMASLFPEMREEILGQKENDQYSFESLFCGDGYSMSAPDNDEITVRHFYHLPSPALQLAPKPKLDPMTGAPALDADGKPVLEDARPSPGRYICYVGEVPVLDRSLDYGVIPLIDFLPKQYLGTALGYSNVWDGLSVNQMIDQVISDVATNMTMFARQVVILDEQSGITPIDIANGARIIKKKSQTEDPKAIQFAAIPGASLPFLEHLQKKLQSIYGLNAVTRGDPDKNITSGTMAALFHSIAIEVNSGLQAAVDWHRERVANLMLDILKVSAEHPMIAAIAGHDERDYLRSFSKGDVAGIRGVRVRTANPMMRTTAGRRDIAEMLLKVPGAITDPAQLTEAIVSGQITPLYGGPRKLRMRISMEDEMLQGKSGEAPPAVEQKQEPPMPPLPNGMTPPQPRPYTCATGVPVSQLDDHEKHILEHSALLASERALTDQAFAAAVHAHIDEHWYVWEQTPPERCIALKRQPYPKLAPPGPPMGGPPPPMPGKGPPGPPPPGPNGGPDKGPPDAPPPKTPAAGPDDPMNGARLPKPAEAPAAA